MGELELPGQSPLFHALHAERYQRQELIRTYEEQFNCRLVVMIDAIFPDGVTLFEELLYDADPLADLHLMLSSPGGDGETAVRLVRSAQARSNKLTVIVPDQAKSAATLLAMGAHRVLMGPTSDLGPVDPQFIINGTLASAKNIIAAVDHAEERIQAAPETYPLHAALLSDVTALMVQQARSALARTEDLMREALASNPARKTKDVEKLVQSLKEPLVDLPASHSAVFNAEDARRAGLPAEDCDPNATQWQLVWRLYTKYFTLGRGARVYEGARSSQVKRGE